MMFPNGFVFDPSRSGRRRLSRHRRRLFDRSAVATKRPNGSPDSRPVQPRSRCETARSCRRSWPPRSHPRKGSTPAARRCGVLQDDHDGAGDCGGIGANDSGEACVDPFRALALLSCHEYRDAQVRGLLPECRRCRSERRMPCAGGAQSLRSRPEGQSGCAGAARARQRLGGPRRDSGASHARRAAPEAVGELTNGCADSANGLSPVLAAVHRHLRSPVRLPAAKLHCDELSSNSTGTAPASQDNGGGNGDHRKVVPKERTC